MLFLGRFLAGAKSFRSFEQAREWAREWSRASGQQMTRDWRKLTSAIRPPNIPANPERVYKEEWKGMRDWLGLTESSTWHRSLRRPPPEIVPLDSRLERFSSHNLALERFVQFARADPAVQFDIFLMPRLSTVSLLFQPRDTQQHRTCGARFPFTQRVGFTRTAGRPSTGRRSRMNVPRFFLTVSEAIGSSSKRRFRRQLSISFGRELGDTTIGRSILCNCLRFFCGCTPTASFAQGQSGCNVQFSVTRTSRPRQP